ncbi:MAG: DUF2304 domain-containing protein [archaeon]|jgi:hypothetical protein|nr:DUF2304 domain-containing protein [Candidatus Paceibacterota bacterium]MDP7260671.1 DUF2304 domain-containing protein [archaeon]|tara:strand:- start:22698 stop:23048 length:351 start_codon:yes stop_codon:yes gene_type:complete
MIAGIQAFGLALGLLMFYYAVKLYRQGKFKDRDFVTWGIVALAIFFVSLYPTVLDSVLSWLKIGRGLDALLVLGLLGVYGFVFQVYIRNQETQRQITNLVRKVALELEQKGRKQNV